MSPDMQSEILSKESVFRFQKHLKDLNLSLPEYHIVLGSGFGEALDAVVQGDWEALPPLPFHQIPGLSAATVPDHAGSYQILRHRPTQLLVQIQKGRLHGYEGLPPREVVKTVLIPRLCGVQNFLLTNAAGGLLPEMTAGDAMLITDHVNFTGMNPLVGPIPTFDGNPIVSRFPDMSQAYRSSLSLALEKNWNREQTGDFARDKALIKLHKGSYIGLLGPNFETPLEIQLFRSWGIGAVGMSTVWEALMLHATGAQVAGLSLIANMAAGLTSETLDHNLVLQTCRASSIVILKQILQTLLEHTRSLPSTDKNGRRG